MTADKRYATMFEALDALAYQILRDYTNGNKADAKMRLQSVLPDRRAYVAFSIVGLHMNTHEKNNPRVIDLENLFMSATF